MKKVGILVIVSLAIGIIHSAFFQAFAKGVHSFYHIWEIYLLLCILSSLLLVLFFYSIKRLLKSLVIIYTTGSILKMAISLLFLIRINQHIESNLYDFINFLIAYLSLMIVETIIVVQELKSIKLK